jgi:hypothetical protein
MTGAAIRLDDGVIWTDSRGRVSWHNPARHHGSLEIRDVVTGAVRRQVHARGLGADPAQQAVVAFDPTGSAVVVAGGDAARVADLTDGHVSRLDLDGSDMSGVALSADHRTLAAMPRRRRAASPLWRAVMPRRCAAPLGTCGIPPPRPAGVSRRRVVGSG